MYKASRSESKRETPNKTRKPNTATAAMQPSKSDKKISTLINNKSTGDIKPSSAVMQSKSGGNILKVNKSGEIKNESFQQMKPAAKIASTQPVKFESVQYQSVTQKPLAPKFPNNVSTNLTSQKPNLTTANSSKIIKTVMRKPEKENLAMGLTKTLNIADTMSPKAVLGRKTIHQK